METENKLNNVVPLRPQFAIFSPQLRKDISESIETHTDKAHVIVDEVEKTISTFLVASVRRVSADFGKRLVQRIFGE